MTELPITDIVVGDRHRQDLGDVAGLARSIRDVGLLQPLVVTADKRLVAGARRLAAVRGLGWAAVPVRVVDNLLDAAALLRAERDENTCREEFTPSEAVAIGAALEALEKAKARERQKEGGRAGGKASGKLPEARTGDTRNVVAEAVGMSGRTYDKAKEVVEAAAADPELRPVLEEMDRTRKVEPAYRKVREKRPVHRRRRRGYFSLDKETQAILGDHDLTHREAQMSALCCVLPPEKRRLVARMVIDGEARDVKEAVALLNAGLPAAERVLTEAEIRERQRVFGAAEEAINALKKIGVSQYKQRAFQNVIDYMEVNR